MGEGPPITASSSLPSLTVAVSWVFISKPDSDSATEELWLSNKCIEAKISQWHKKNQPRTTLSFSTTRKGADEAAVAGIV